MLLFAAAAAAGAVNGSCPPAFLSRRINMTASSNVLLRRLSARAVEARGRGDVKTYRCVRRCSSSSSSRRQQTKSARGVCRGAQCMARRFTASIGAKFANEFFTARHCVSAAAAEGRRKTLGPWRLLPARWHTLVARAADACGRVVSVRRPIIDSRGGSFSTSRSRTFLNRRRDAAFAFVRQRAVCLYCPGRHRNAVRTFPKKDLSALFAER